jgi:DNA-binding response OmpR family regulator
MPTAPVRLLVIDHEASAADQIMAAYRGGNVVVERVCTGHEGQLMLLRDSGISAAVIRGNSQDVNALAICRTVRQVGNDPDLPLLVIIPESNTEQVAGMLEAGATDVLLEPWEARELRMRLGLQSAVVRRRVDSEHRTLREDDPPVADVVSLRPVLQTETLRYGYEYRGEKIPATTLERWATDSRVIRMELDQVLACPCCQAIPTFRGGCSCCGSGIVQRDVLIHHFACAYVGSESKFRSGNELVCPKCRLNGLVAGTDFEFSDGVMRCADCGAVSGDTTMIGHCLACQHRFPVNDASVVPLIGYQVPADLLPRRSHSETLAGSRPVERIDSLLSSAGR